MSTANLIYVNNKLNLSMLEDEFNIQFNEEFRNYNLISTKLWYESHFPHNRSGHNNFWNLHVPDKFKIPAPRNNFNLTFEEITNQRAQDLEKKLSSTNLPVIVNWSGGIDSTVILCAILKNFSKHNLERVTVLLNNSSYFENPNFFNEIIVKNFNYKLIDQWQKDPWTNAIVVSGEPADQIWIHADILEILHRFPNSSRNDLRNNPDILLDFLASKSDRKHSEWFYNLILNESSASPVPIVTYEDFYWWANYNYYLIGNSLKLYLNDGNQYSAESFSAFEKNYWPWYLSDEYQLWSIKNNSNNCKISNSIQTYKLDAKSYIFDIDQNEYYYYYKTKTGSLNQYYTNLNQKKFNVGKIVALFDNGEVIKLYEKEKLERFILSNSKIMW